MMSYWDWPICTGKLADAFYFNKNKNWEMEKKELIQYSLHGTMKHVITVTEVDNDGKNSKISKEKPLAKFVSHTIIKKDSITLSVSIHEIFRRRGYKEFKIKTFDTAIVVKYHHATYETIVDRLNYINCDRFLKSENPTNFYVKTPGFENAQMLVFFKNINAFMPLGYENGTYEARKIPLGEDVDLIAVGKKGDEFYYGKKPFTVSENAIADVAMQPVKYDEMKKMFETLRYKK